MLMGHWYIVSGILAAPVAEVEGLQLGRRRPVHFVRSPTSRRDPHHFVVAADAARARAAAASFGCSIASK